MSKVLIIDDDSAAQEVLGTRLESLGHAVFLEADGVAGLQACRLTRPDVVLLDLRLPDCDGLEILAHIKEACPETEVIILTAYATVDNAVLATKRGAYDYLIKPADPLRLEMLIEKAVEKGKIVSEVASLRRQLTGMGIGGKLLGTSVAMQEVYRTITNLACTDATVLITGESGTGKELVARAIHRNSARKARLFVPVNCAAIPEALLESELFGHTRGAFTGATADKPGLFEEAQGGTLFLDEVAELPLTLQPKLLRVLQESEVRKVGSTRIVTVDTRVVASANVDLLRLVREHRFREDLYYRLNVFRVHLPPLREHREDIPLLVEAILEEHSTRYGKTVKAIDEPAMKILSMYEWPGNVRELRNILERAVLLCEGAMIRPSHLSAEVTGTGGQGAAFSFPFGAKLAEAEKCLIIQTLQEVKGNKARAARILGISLKTLYNKLARFQR
ncbi:MAG: sigma-54-dependent Fis family transcriptional regulator [Nitrospirae bacterium]|nr:sigma-54-dependent Fis family transcriptional regulator [Nitrospirota bacterium]